MTTRSNKENRKSRAQNTIKTFPPETDEEQGEQKRFIANKINT
jgi:hypothetical protein